MLGVFIIIVDSFKGVSHVLDMHTYKLCGTKSTKVGLTLKKSKIWGVMKNI